MTSKLLKIGMSTSTFSNVLFEYLNNFIKEEELSFISIANMLMMQFTKIVFLVGYLGRHNKTNNRLYEMSPLQHQIIDSSEITITR